MNRKPSDNTNFENRIGINIMNQNAIISLAMLYALWKTKHNDLLDLIRPFVLYAVGTTTEIGAIINIEAVCSCLENEFGYKSFQSAVVIRILERERSSSIPASARHIQKSNRSYRLIQSYEDLITNFKAKQSECKAHSDAVTSALTSYLNTNTVCKRSDYTQAETESLLLSFFSRKGGSVILSIEDLRQMTSRGNEIDYCIGHFILEQHENKTIIVDYLVELVAGFFVTTALYLQAENHDITKAAYKDVSFFLDTRLLLAFLGYKTKEENDSVQEMVRSLQKNGAIIACFQYNIDEVESILDAYYNSLLSSNKKKSSITLEHFDECGKPFTYVEIAKKQFQQQLKNANIVTYTPAQALDKYGVSASTKGLLDDDHLKRILLSINPKYNFQSLPDDLTAINTISRIRKAKKIDYVERCKAVFVTSNAALVSGTKQLLKEKRIDVGFPIVISEEDLCVLAWIKDFERNQELPKMRLLENVLAATTPDKELMDSYFDHIYELEHYGKLTAEEASVLRVDQFAKKELMIRTRGESANLTPDTITTIKDKLLKNSHEQGVAFGIQQAEKKEKMAAAARRSHACKRVEDEVNEKFLLYEKIGVKSITVLGILLSVALMIASYFTLISQIASPVTWIVVIATVVSTAQGILPLISRDNVFTKMLKSFLDRQKFIVMDAEKDKVLSYLGESNK